MSEMKSESKRDTFSNQLVQRLKLVYEPVVSLKKPKMFASKGVSTEPIKMTDWKTSRLRDRLLRGVP